MAKRLASGRHQLTRDEVAAHQKQRLFKALGAVMGVKGYSSTTVDDLIKNAGVSRATFYQHFESKQDCFMAGYARMQGHIIDAIGRAPTTGTPMQRFSTMLDQYLGFMSMDPPTARLYLVEVYSAGPEAMTRRFELQQEFVAGVAKLFNARSQADRFACKALVAAISSLVISALTDGRPEDILALKKPVLTFAERAMGPAAQP